MKKVRNITLLLLTLLLCAVTVAAAEHTLCYEAQRSDCVYPDAATEALLTRASTTALDGITYTCYTDYAVVTKADTALSGTVTVPAKVNGLPVTQIGNEAFKSCSNLEALILPDTVTTIGYEVLWGCNNLRHLELSENLVSIDGLLGDLKSLHWLYLPESLEKIFNTTAEIETELSVLFDEMALLGMSGSYAEEYAERQGYDFYAVDQGYGACGNIILRMRSDTTWEVVACYEGGGINGSPDAVTEIPAECGGHPITRIAPDAFANCGSSAIIVGSNVRVVEENAFDHCTYLETLVVCNPDCVLAGNIFGTDTAVYAPPVLYGWLGSTTQAYAEQNGYLFGVYDTLPFDDIDRTQYYYQPVLWAYESGITTGTGPTTFSPDCACTRAQVVTFLWRAMGEPQPMQADMPFADVAAGAYYYEAVCWAYENGITTGTTETTFSPDEAVTRGQFITFLWRAKGQPGAAAANPFTDVAAPMYYYEPILWAYENGVTTGISESRFAPDNNCTRAQIVTFLHRTLVEL